MSVKTQADPVKLFIAVLGENLEQMAQAVAQLEQTYGPVDLRSESFPFNHTAYYEEEMGSSLQRQFFSFERLADPACIVELKLAADEIEQASADHHRRIVNLDPGYMDFCKVVLASYKYNGQKIYLRDGVYADVVLLYVKGIFEPFLWTFPDFSTGAYSPVLAQIRGRFKQQMKERRGGYTPRTENNNKVR